MKPPLAVFEEYIAHHRLKITPQRRKIVDMLLSSEGHHWSAEEFHMHLKAAGISVGQATVYRTLKLLCASNAWLSASSRVCVLGKFFRRSGTSSTARLTP